MRLLWGPQIGISMILGEAVRFSVNCCLHWDIAGGFLGCCSLCGVLLGKRGDGFRPVDLRIGSNCFGRFSIWVFGYVSGACYSGSIISDWPIDNFSFSSRW